ncbi:MAG: hypothetical protein ACBZ72_06250 [Candidatus Bathyarchaeia archaeon]|jgi:hypothetical protein
MLESESKLVNRPTQTAGKLYDKFYIYIPAELSKDSAFPFKADEKVKIKIDVKNKRLIIEKLE